LELLADAQRWAATITPAEVLSQIASPFAADPRPAVSEALNHAGMNTVEAFRRRCLGDNAHLLFSPF
jgi:hypothetical protein